MPYFVPGFVQKVRFVPLLAARPMRRFSGILPLHGAAQSSRGGFSPTRARPTRRFSGIFRCVGLRIKRGLPAQPLVYLIFTPATSETSPASAAISPSR